MGLKEGEGKLHQLLRYERDFSYRKTKSLYYCKLKDILINFRKLKKQREERSISIKVFYSLNKIENQINLEMSKLKDQLSSLDEVKKMLEEYNKNQKILKDQVYVLFSFMERIKAMKDDLSLKI